MTGIEIRTYPRRCVSVRRKNQFAKRESHFHFFFAITSRSPCMGLISFTQDVNV